MIRPHLLLHGFAGFWLSGTILPKLLRLPKAQGQDFRYSYGILFIFDVLGCPPVVMGGLVAAIRPRPSVLVRVVYLARELCPILGNAGVRFLFATIVELGLLLPIARVLSRCPR